MNKPAQRTFESDLNIMATKNPSKTAVADEVVTSNALAVVGNRLPATGDDMAAAFAADANAGFSNIDADSIAIPFLAVLQKNSPQCDPDDGAYMPDAKPGMLFNTVTRQLFDGRAGVLLVPCEYRRRYLQWAPREAGGGFKGEHLPEAVSAARAQGRYVELEGRLYVPSEDGSINPKKNDRVSDTRIHYCLMIDPDTAQATQVVISLASTQVKKSKQLMGVLTNVQMRLEGGRMINPPTFANVISMKTVPESNEKGSWTGVVFEHAGFVQDANLYKMAKSFHALVATDAAEANFESAAAAGAAGSESTASGGF